ncbi:MAG: DUF4198 domain-containing protein [Campylobacteraceae bacterium]|nr:DUF4198 domain-containing protein [Campylobacteraceae bacterium]
MKKKFISFCLAGLVATGAFGHDLWVWGENGDKFSANIIYGHTFPEPEKIPENRADRFNGVDVIGIDGKQALKQSGELHQYESEKLKDGVYIVHVKTNPVTWIKKSGEKRREINKTRKDTTDKVEVCATSSMQSKAFIKVGEASDSSVILKPLEEGLEITPVSIKSIDDIKVGELLKFKITLDGKPVKHATIYANYSGYGSNLNMATAGYARSDLEGNFEFRPLTKGLWYLKSSVNTDSGNPDCERNSDSTTLVFEIK